jgi:predicted glycogen debranching enzyme
VISGREIEFGREICGDLHAAESREWLVTNGIGGFASGTVAGSATRRYHGVLIAALQPPVGRTQLVSSIDETLRYNGKEYSLATHRWASGAVEPQGFRHIESFHLDGKTPVWIYAFADGLLEKRIWMSYGENTTFIHYTLVRASGSVEIDFKCLVNYREFHSVTHAGEWRMRIEPVPGGVRVLAFEGATPFYLRSVGTTCEPRNEWYFGAFYSREQERGLDSSEDLLSAALFRARLDVGASVMFVASTNANASPDGGRVRAESAEREAELLRSYQLKKTASVENHPAWLPQLLLAADQFIVKRSLPGRLDGHSVIAGYHWFGDWGRDAMIALPGLTLATGRPKVGRQIILAFERYVNGGMLPNNFPDSGGNPEYNTVDATLWFFEAVRQYYAETQDRDTLQELFPVLADVIDAHRRGARFNIHVDPADGLLYAGGPGVQLTWMDAKIGDWIITPRTGKPVEVNALWINALETQAAFARQLVKPSGRLEELAAQAKQNFQKFWNAERNCCFDVIDAPGFGNDASLRPNQIFAVSLPVSPLTPTQQKSVVDLCARHLLTSYGLRSLAPGETGYQGRCEGDPRMRDAAYHQGTVWGWLLGPFALAHFRVYNNRETALRFLEPLAQQIRSYGLGTLGEIFDGDVPFIPRGCIAQAWTVAELLRVWHALQSS